MLLPILGIPLSPCFIPVKRPVCPRVSRPRVSPGFLSPGFPQDFEKQTATRGGAKQGLSAITTEGDEVEIVVSVVTLETPRHGSRLGDYGAEFHPSYRVE